LSDGRVLHYRDIRRLGTVALATPERFAAIDKALGVEPLDPAFTGDHLSVLLRGRRQAIKKVLMDQRIVAGIGNIYANEALWRARIDPSREAGSIPASDASVLRDSLVDVLTESISLRGTSFRDYRDASGARGGFVERLVVYGHEGDPCPRCRRRLIGTHAIDGRMTVLCAHCQK
jgi:formamidopyrimidine-DNA glycosylase